MKIIEKKRNIEQAVIQGFEKKGIQVRRELVVKNGCEREGLSLSGLIKDCRINPLIYLDHYYEQYMMLEPEEAGEKIIESVLNFFADLNEEVAEIMEDFEECFTPHYLSSHIRVGLQRTSPKNKDSYLLKESPFEGIEEYLYLEGQSVGERRYTISLKQNHLHLSGITEQEAWSYAYNNMEEAVKILCSGIQETEHGMEPVIKSFIEEIGDLELKEPMYCLTNREDSYGCSSVLSKVILRKIAKKHRTGTLIFLPSSIHEGLIIPYTGESLEQDISYYSAWVASATEDLLHQGGLSQEEVLSYQAYAITV